MTQSHVSGRHAFVTGGASGIGRAAAMVLSERGHVVTVIDRNDPGDVANSWLPLDLNDPHAALPRIDGPCDVLVNAAGLPPRDGTEADVLRVNFLALRRLTRHVVPAMAAGSAIVNVASKAGAHWRANIAQVRRLVALDVGADLAGFVLRERIDTVRAYDLSKEAVVAWTKASTAALIDRGLRMNCVSPAAVETPILGDFVSAFGARAERGIEMTRRSGTAEEVAHVIAFLSAPESGWVRGCNIEADGGLTAQLETEAAIGPGVACAFGAA